RKNSRVEFLIESLASGDIVVRRPVSFRGHCRLQDKQFVPANAGTGNHDDEGHAFIRGGNRGRYDATFRMAEHTDAVGVDLRLSLKASDGCFGVGGKISGRRSVLVA